MDKKQLRKELIEVLTKKDKYDAEIAMIKRLRLQREWQHAKTIGITLSMPHEIDTYSIIKLAQIEGKEVFVPHCDYKSKEMSFVKFNRPSDLYLDEKKIQAVKAPHETCDTLDLILVPGLGFDRKGYRVGYGGGFYDRYLADYKGKTISLALEDQLIEFEPDAFDIPVMKIITENEVIYGDAYDHK